MTSIGLSQNAWIPPTAVSALVAGSAPATNPHLSQHGLFQTKGSLYGPSLPSSTRKGVCCFSLLGSSKCQLKVACDTLFKERFQIVNDCVRSSPIMKFDSLFALITTKVHSQRTLRTNVKLSVQQLPSFRNVNYGTCQFEIIHIDDQQC